jgi:hypothetical protein
MTEECFIETWYASTVHLSIVHVMIIVASYVT